MRRAAIQAGAGLSLGYLGQTHPHLLAPASADDRQIHGFTRFGLAERASSSLTLRVRCASTAMMSSCDWPIPPCFISIAPSTAGRRKEKPSHGQRYQRHLDGRSPTLQPGRCLGTIGEHLINLYSGEPDAAFELTPPVAYFNSN